MAKLKRTQTQILPPGTPSMGTRCGQGQIIGRSISTPNLPSSSQSHARNLGLGGAGAGLGGTGSAFGPGVASLGATSLNSREGLGPPKEGIFSRNWTSEHKRLLHQESERHWLRLKNKHHYIDFSDAERAELRRYFEALATSDASGQRIGLDRLENMLISLGLAATRREVKRIVETIDTNGNGELDFEEYLEIFNKRTDSEIYQVFKAMMEGRLGDRNLNFQTVVSTYRRKLFLDATGASTMRAVRLPSDGYAIEHSAKVLHNFAALQRARYAEALEAWERGEGAMDKDAMSFEDDTNIPLGNLGMVWHRETRDHGLVSSRPSSADRSKRLLGMPDSPRTVINSIVKVPKTKKRVGPHGATIVIQAPALEEGSRASSPKMSATLRR